jgi:CMP-N,N'-diacetyllegionaminic acid synthase
LKVLIVGYGSIGRRHYTIVNSLMKIKQIDIVTKQNIKDIITYRELKEIDNMDIYDYFIISSETAKHYEELRYISSKVENKKILVEKPLYDKRYRDFIVKNQIFVAYNLRFHPIIDKLKELLNSKSVYYANIICGQYLPTWRLDKDYRESYSSDITRGGGVLRDLSHELDYASWLFGDIRTIDSINTKISDLEINSDDIFTAIAVSKDKVIINLTVDYISKIPIRRLIIHTKYNTIEADLIRNTLIFYNKDGKRDKIVMEDIDRDYTYRKMHKSILDSDFANLCNFKDAQRVVEIIDNIEFTEL